MTELINKMLSQLKSREYKALRIHNEERPILFPVDIFGFNFGANVRKLSTEANLSPNYRKVFERGLLALRDELAVRADTAQSKEKREFGEKMLKEVDICIGFANDMREAALAAGNERLANALSRVPLYPAESFYEACVTLKACIYFLRRVRAAHIGLGRFDVYMYPYFARDLKRGVTRNELFETLEAFFVALNYDTDLYGGVQLGDNGQSIVLGGTDKDGNYSFNELSRMCMDASLELNLIDPKVNLRVSKNTPNEIFEFGTLLTKQGLGFPQYSNDDVVIPGLISLGYSPEDAYNYAVAACWEFIIPEKGADIPNLGVMNFPLVVSRAVRKHLAECDSFESFYKKVDGEISAEADRIIEEKNAKPYKEAPLISFFVDGCTERLLDLHHGGGIYTNYGCHGTGIANAADALAAIKKLVYDEKTVSTDELLCALDANFEGYVELRNKLRACPKMGNNDDYVDSIASRLMDCFTKNMNGRDNAHGGIWRAGTGSAMEYIKSAEICPATADGRLAGEPYSSSFSPSLDIKTNGLLSVIQSFTKYDMKRIISGGPLTLEIHDSVLRNDIGIKKTAMLVKTFITLGGHQLQLNSINRERLLDAQAHPEEHKNLIVRVWGWSGYFCELDLPYQEHIIRRTEYLN